jgi:hypothetical protein
MEREEDEICWERKNFLSFFCTPTVRLMPSAMESRRFLIDSDCDKRIQENSLEPDPSSVRPSPLLLLLKSFRTHHPSLIAAGHSSSSSILVSVCNELLKELIRRLEI